MDKRGDSWHPEICFAFSDPTDFDTGFWYHTGLKKSQLQVSLWEDGGREAGYLKMTRNSYWERQLVMIAKGRRGRNFIIEWEVFFLPNRLLNTSCFKGQILKHIL